MRRDAQAWYAGESNSNVAQKSNGWSGNNRQRWINSDYDARFEQLQQATTLDGANTILIQMNDLLIENVVIVPLVNRSADSYAISK